MAPSISRSLAVSRRMRATSRLSIGASRLKVQDRGENQRRHNGSIRLDDEPWRVAVELAPGDLFVGHGAAIGAVGRGTVRNLAEISPQAAWFAKVLYDQRDDANREIAGNAAADLKKAHRLRLGIGLVPFDKRGHLLEPRLDHLETGNVSADFVRHKNISEGRVLPPRRKHRQVF